MEAMQKSIDDMSKLFSKKMEEFQKDLDSATSNVQGHTSPVSKITHEFSTFKNFVIFALKNLQAQLYALSQQVDDIEMRSRRKMLLIHKLPEEENEDIAAILHNTFLNQLNVSNSSVDSFSRCHRMGRYNDQKARPVLIKFKDISLRDEVWHHKSKLKGSGMVISEYLTKPRHEVFLQARQRYGVTKSWTNNGKIFVIGSDGSRHCIVNSVELDAIRSPVANPVPTASSEIRTGNSSNKPPINISTARTRRPLKQK